MPTNTWYFSRRQGDRRVTVRATWLDRLDLWGIICRVDGELTDLTQSVEPWEDCHEMMTRVLSDLAEQQLAETETETWEDELANGRTMTAVEFIQRVTEPRTAEERGA